MGKIVKIELAVQINKVTKFLGIPGSDPGADEISVYALSGKDETLLQWEIEKLGPSNIRLRNVLSNYYLTVLKDSFSSIVVTRIPPDDGYADFSTVSTENGNVFIVSSIVPLSVVAVRAGGLAPAFLVQIPIPSDFCGEWLSFR